MPRPTKLTADTVKHITQAIAVGAPTDQAARYAGVNPSTVFDWIERGRTFLRVHGDYPDGSVKDVMRWVDGDPARAVYAREREDQSDTPRKSLYAELAPLLRKKTAPAVSYPEFVDRVEKARGDTVVRALGVIQKAMPDSWQAAAWLLERRYPDEFGRRQRLEHTGAGGGAVEFRPAESLGDPRAIDAAERLLELVAGDGGPGDGGDEPLDVEVVETQRDD